MWGLCFICLCLRTSSLGKPLLPPPPPHLLLVSKSANTSSIRTNSVVPQDPNCTVVFMISESSSSDPLPWSLLRGWVLHATDPFPGSTIPIPSPVVCAILRKHTWKACLSPKSPYPSLVTDPSLPPWLRPAHEETLPHQPLGFLTPIHSQPLPCPSSSNDEAH